MSPTVVTSRPLPVYNENGIHADLMVRMTNDGMSTQLCSRILGRKALWLLRISPLDLEKVRCIT